MSLRRSLQRKSQRAGQPKPHPKRKEPPVFNVNYKELEEKLVASLTKMRDFRHPLNYDIHSLEDIKRELERVLKVYGNASAEVSPTGRTTIHDPPVYVQAGEGWKRIPED